MMGNGIAVIVIVEGIVLLCVDFLAYVYRKITETIGLGWGCIGILFILLGAVPGLSDWCDFIPKEASLAFLLITAFVLLGTFRMCCYISQLLRKNQELAMHVSLLNQENEAILHELEVLREKDEA